MSIQMERNFQDAMIECYHTASEYGYYHTDFLRMIVNRGGIGAAKHMLATNEFSSGLIVLSGLGKLDISMEAMILKKKWSHFFSDEEINTAATRLRRLGHIKKAAI